jgi:hypothetical protein
VDNNRKSAQQNAIFSAMEKAWPRMSEFQKGYLLGTTETIADLYPEKKSEKPDEVLS